MSDVNVVAIAERHRLNGRLVSDSDLEALCGEIYRLRGIVERAGAAMEAMHPEEAERSCISDADYARLWNATAEMLTNG